MPLNSRDKGRRGEIQVRNLFRKAGFTCERTPLSGALSWMKSDLHGIPGYGVEVKWQQRLCIPEWLRQVRRDTPEGCVPLLVFRRNHEEWQAVVPLAHLLELIGERRDRAPDPGSRREDHARQDGRDLPPASSVV